MCFDIFLPLFLKPIDELGFAGDEPTGADVLALADELSSRLRRTAEIVDKLRQDGWPINQGLYDLSCSSCGYKSEEELAELLRGLGIDPEDVTIHLREEDDDEDLLADE